MTFVDDEYQNLRVVRAERAAPGEPGNEAEITLDTYPGRIIKAHVDSVIWAQAQGQLDASGDLPRTTFAAAARTLPVKLVVGEHDARCFSPPARAARRRSTPNIWRWCTSSARCCCAWGRTSTT